MTTTTLSPLAKYILALLLTYAGPGKSVNSREVMPECGTNPKEPACELAPVCSVASAVCRPPKWSKVRGGWARAESREAAALRYEHAAIALTRVATYLTRCTDDDGTPDEDCKPLRWPEGPRSLAMAALAASYWESGYREDIMEGHPPVGRGSDGEVCVMQVLPKYSTDAKLSQWLVREGIIDPESEDENARSITEAEAVKLMLGSDIASLKRCYETGMRILARKRWFARYKCKGIRWSYAMFAFYGTGNKCSTHGSALGDWAADREGSYQKFMAKWPNKVSMPEWAVADYGLMPGQPKPGERGPGIVPPKWARKTPSRATGTPLEVIPGDVPARLQLRATSKSD
jgi:hypothetical protein